MVKPEAVVCPGATAAQAILGRDFKVSQRRGEFIESPLAPIVMATAHPSSILRATDDESRRREKQLFIADLAKLARKIED